MSTPVLYQNTPYPSINALARHLNLTPYLIRRRFASVHGRQPRRHERMIESDLFSTRLLTRGVREIRYDGLLITYSEASRISGICPQTLLSRKRAGWSDRRIMTTPVRGSKS